MLVARLALALSDRAGAAAHAGPVFSLSLIHHHLLICSALFTSIVSFHHCPASQRLSHRCLPRTLMHLRSVLTPPPAPHHHIRSRLFFFAVTDSPLLSRSLRSHLSRCSVPVSFFYFFYCHCVKRPRRCRAWAQLWPRYSDRKL